MKTIEVATVRKVLKKEKAALAERVEADWKSGRVTCSAEASARLARVLLLEGLLDGSIALEGERESSAAAPRGDNTLDLEG